MSSWRKTLVKVKIQRGIFQGEVLSPLLFLIVMMPFSYIFKFSFVWFYGTSTSVSYLMRNLFYTYQLF